MCWIEKYADQKSEKLIALLEKAFNVFRYRSFPHNEPNFEEWMKSQTGPSYLKDYSAQQTAELRKQLAEKEAEIEMLKSLRRFNVDCFPEDDYVECDISEDEYGEWVRWSDVERILSKKGAGDE